MTTPQDKEAAAQELKEREVLRRMLHTPPKKHSEKVEPTKKTPRVRKKT